MLDISQATNRRKINATTVIAISNLRKKPSLFTSGTALEFDLLVLLIAKNKICRKIDLLTK
jgi:hypothetical protein